MAGLSKAIKKTMKKKASWEEEEEDDFDSTIKAMEIAPICIDCEYLGCDYEWYHSITRLKPKSICLAQGLRPVEICYGSTNCKKVFHSQMKFAILETGEDK